MAGAQRSAENKARDRYRHPLETLLFFGLRPDMTVIEMAPGNGWYSEILAPVLRDRGRLIGAIPPDDGPEAKYAQLFRDRLTRDPQIFDRVQTVAFQPSADSVLAPDGSVDMVVTFRSVHGWLNHAQFEDVLSAIHRALKPGGILGLVQHRAVPRADAKVSAQQGYVPEEYVIEKARAIGFELQARSEVNANPKDTRDYPEGVWTLPPTLRLGATDRERYLAIGESDRMTLRFVKVR